jgi:hypothetical protein
MRKVLFAVALVGVILGVSLVGVPTSAVEPVTLRLDRFALDESFVKPNAPTELEAFIPTGSRDRRCLVTLNESSFAVAGTTVYCGNRLIDGEYGLFVHVFLPEPAPADVVFRLTVYQNDAAYGDPVPCAAVGPC